MFNLEISVGYILTAVTVAVSCAALIREWRKDRQRKEKEEAERIRQTAGQVLAKLERWKVLSIRLVEEIQSAIVDADAMAVNQRPLTEVRDFFWKALTTAHTVTSQAVVDEDIESAYAPLYGYDPGVRGLFVEAVRELETIDARWFISLLHDTQQDILTLKPTGRLESAELGNVLRKRCGTLGHVYGTQMDSVVECLREEMLKLITASDRNVSSKAVRLRSADEVFVTVGQDTEGSPLEFRAFPVDPGPPAVPAASWPTVQIARKYADLLGNFGSSVRTAHLMTHLTVCRAFEDGEHAQETRGKVWSRQLIDSVHNSTDSSPMGQLRSRLVWTPNYPGEASQRLAQLAKSNDEPLFRQLKAPYRRRRGKRRWR